MDSFVCDTLNRWGLSKWIRKFKDEGIDRESLYCLEDEDIDNIIPVVGPRARFKERLKLLKAIKHPEEAADLTEVLPSTSDRGKRKMDLQEESSNLEPPSKRPHDRVSRSFTETMVLSDLKKIMEHVHARLLSQENEGLTDFLKSKILNVETDKKKLVGVFGKTGSGKSALINAVIGQKNLLPSGSVNACTSVVIKVEANMHNPVYEAEIEFITKEEWKAELLSMKEFLGNNTDEEKEDDYHHETVEKLSALYGDEWKTESPASLMDNKYFIEIPEFLQTGKKILTCESAKRLSTEFAQYTRNETKQDEGPEVTRWYWPLVKCVTVKVPHNDLLQHVTLVDLPGNGDRNKSRDQMWKGIVGSCSTVWIVSEITRAASEQESWEILQSAAALNGGKCQRIHFICTKTDFIEDLDDHSMDYFRDGILKRNMEAKEEVLKEFNRLNTVKKHFRDDCFKVFTVSSREFFERQLLTQEDSEIPKLREILKSLNDCHTEIVNDVSAAHGALSLIQRSSCAEVAAKKTEVRKDLERNITLQLELVQKSLDQAKSPFEKCLSEGVENSLNSCEKCLMSALNPPMKAVSAFDKILKSVVNNGGVYRSRRGKELNLNMMLASFLTDSIDEEFRKTFPTDEECEPFNGVINKVSLDTEGLIHKYKDLEPQLLFLKKEEEKIKTNLNAIIHGRKTAIYSSLTETIGETMQECYKRAARCKGNDSFQKMIRTIEGHVHNSKNTMFDRAKNVMLCQLQSLMKDILKTLEENMRKSIEFSLRTDDCSIPDVSTELVMVQKLSDELKNS